MTDEISQLLVLRRRIAAMSQALQERELAGRQLRLELEAKLRTTGIVKTEAEKFARAAPEYVAHEKRTIEIEYDRAIASAEAEALLLGIRLRVADMSLGVE